MYKNRRSPKVHTHLERCPVQRCRAQFSSSHTGLRILANKNAAAHSVRKLKVEARLTCEGGHPGTAIVVLKASTDIGGSEKLARPLRQTVVLADHKLDDLRREHQVARGTGTVLELIHRDS